MTKGIPTTFIGNAGEYYVMAELLRRGIVAALAPRNLPEVDILATKGGQTVRIRVKTRQAEKAKNWVWSVKVPKWTGLTREECIEEGTKLTPFKNVGETGDYCVLVGIGDKAEFYIVPTVQVEAILQKNYRCWAHELGRGGREHSVRNYERRLEPRQVADTQDDWDALWPPE